jgi:hypothetical protein
VTPPRCWSRTLLKNKWPISLSGRFLGDSSGMEGGSILDFGLRILDLGTADRNRAPLGRAPFNPKSQIQNPK